MSKIAEKKASEAYPNALIGNLDNLKKDGYIKGYDQAMQDFLEKAEKWLKENSSKYIDIKDGILVFKKTLITDFKKYMQDESEN